MPIPQWQNPSLSVLHHPPPNLSLHQLKQIHAHLFRRSLHDDPVLVTKLLSSAASSGFVVPFAARLFLSVPSPDLVLLNSMLRAYVRSPLPPDLALSFYVAHLLTPGFVPDTFTYPCVLKACAALPHAPLGRQLHAAIAKDPAGAAADVFVLNSLVDMYFKCSDPASAARAFGAIRDPNSTSWNVMMSGLSASGDLRSARALFEGMTDAGRDVVSWNTLVSAYARAGEMDAARELFDGMPTRNLVSWNALIAGYSQNGRNAEALEAFRALLASGGVEPDDATLVSVVSACNGVPSLSSDTVDQVVGLAKSSRSVSVSTALLCLYAKAGRIEEAREVFDRVPHKDLVAWNAMIAGYSQNQRPGDAIASFQSMQKLGVEPDAVTMVSVVDACSQLGALGMGEWAHAYAKKNRIEMDVFLMTALVDMYAKCGDLDRSRLLFSEVPDKDLACFNAMIKGLAIHGKGKEALELFSSMEGAGMVFNDLTFLALLGACSHAGLVAEGLELFESMQSSYGITPRIEHYGCVVDLLGRAGRLDEAYGFVKDMPIEPDAVVWGALLGACRLHRNIELAEVAAQRLVELDPRHDSNYVLLSNVYASLGRWEEVEKVRGVMKGNQVSKELGWSAVEMDGTVHEFTAKDRRHPRTEEIYKAWDAMVERLEAVGYEPEEALSRHSEKLALSFALIGSPARTAIRIVKNLRICSDCHRAMELVSEVEQREIIVRDRSRFHRFHGGSCSCGGYW
ncbi:pentatricopeptide repeat-containing protein-like [Iris pallida]|uniref:Pentatricopeptide repeat-containing protein-like n=1 Tax=Iris pallida TaxID=29817 RepID=A0AAX6I744_IRIPA|nr:pentatricopeptide repeat-containing protein-like [Iris pallida]